MSLLGFIHRVPDPFRALSSLADRSEMIIFEWKALKHGPHDDAYAYLSPKEINREDFYGTEYWLLSFSAVERILIRQGFKYFHRIDDPRQRRAIPSCRKMQAPQSLIYRMLLFIVVVLKLSYHMEKIF